MKLNDIVANSNYITDEEIIDTNIVGMSNSAIAEINSKCGTKLPFYTEDNVSTTEYWAIDSSWQLRLIEPYISFTIAANDTDSNARDFHYNRFLGAISDFKEFGIASIAESDPITGEPTGFKGDSDNMVKVDPSNVTMHWMGWI